MTRRTAAGGASPDNGAVARPDVAAVRLTGLHKSFGRTQAVRGVDLTVAPGEVVAFLGPNGAGKSTTIDMLLGLTGPDSGSVALFGDDPVSSECARRRRRIGGTGDGWHDRVRRTSTDGSVRRGSGPQRW